MNLCPCACYPFTAPAAKIKGFESSLQQREIQLQQEVDKRTEVRRVLDAKLLEMRDKDRALGMWVSERHAFDNGDQYQLNVLRKHGIFLTL